MQIQRRSPEDMNRDTWALLLCGATLSATKLCELAHAWWDTRLMPDWRPRTRSENQEILDRLGLVGPFWQLPR